MKKRILALALISALTSNIAFSQAEEIKPNVLLIVADDLGYSDISPFGGEISTPHLQMLADEGIRFSQYYTAPMSAPARSMIMTGNSNHEAGMGAMWWYDSTEKKPGYELRLTDRVVTMPEVFRDNGYQTLMAGKWHLGFKHGASPFNRGFNRSFALLGGGTSHFNDAIPLGAEEEFHTFYELDGKQVELPEDFYSSNFYATTLNTWIKETPINQPVFAYLAFTAPHDPIQAPDEWIAKFSNEYQNGYEDIYQARMQNLIDGGFLASNVNIPDLNLEGKWEGLSYDEKRFEIKKMQVYAAMIAYMDDQIGRVIETLKETGRYDNTIILFVSDNGANAGGRELYDTEEYFINIQNTDDSFENLGRKGSFTSVGPNWADVNNAPYQIHHKTTSAQGGINTNFLMKIPSLDSNRIGELNNHYFAAQDIAPTLYSLANISLNPGVLSNNSLVMRGIDQSDSLLGEVATPKRKSFALELHNQSLFIDGEWKVRRLSKTYPEAIKGGWELFNIQEDPLETNDLALKNPKKLEELVDKYEDYATTTLVIDASGKFIPYNKEY